MKYRLRVPNTFERELRRLGQQDKDRVWKTIGEIQESPYSYKFLTGQLTGTKSARVGNIRIIFAIDEHAKRILLLHIGYRGKVYEH